MVWKNMGIVENIDARLLYEDFKRRGLFNGEAGNEGRRRLTLGVSGAIVKLLETEDILKMAASRLPVRNNVNSEEDVYPYCLESGETGEIYLAASSLFWENRSRRWRLMVAAGRNVTRVDSRLELCCSLNELKVSKQMGRDFVLAVNRYLLEDEKSILPLLLERDGKLDKLHKNIVNNVAGLMASYLISQPR